MAAPKGNNYWQFRNKHGRSHKYTPEKLWAEYVKYVEWLEENPLLEEKLFNSFLDYSTDIYQNLVGVNDTAEGASIEVPEDILVVCKECMEVLKKSDFVERYDRQMNELTINSENIADDVDTA